jgi:hypothetical protein
MFGVNERGKLLKTRKSYLIEQHCTMDLGKGLSHFPGPGRLSFVEKRTEIGKIKPIFAMLIEPAFSILIISFRV